MPRPLPAPRAAALTIVALGLAHAAPARADEVRLRDGRVIEGSVLDDGDHLLIRRRLGEVRVPKADVTSVRETDDDFRRLERLRRELAQGNADERYRFAAACRDLGFEDEARRAFLGVLRLDADHPGARAALGFVRHEGRWVTLADKHRAEGLVEHRGAWVTPAQKAELEREALARTEAERRAREEALAAREEERRAAREAERDARRERIRAYELELARARARERARAEADVPMLGTAGPAVVNGVFVPGAGISTWGRWSVLGGGYPGWGGAWPASPLCPTPGPRVRRVGWGFGTQVQGTHQGNGWQLRWRVGY